MCQAPAPYSCWTLGPPEALGRRARVSGGHLPDLGQQFLTKFEVFQCITTGDSMLAQVLSPVGGRKQSRGEGAPPTPSNPVRSLEGI